MEISRIVENAVEGLGFEFVDFESSPKGRLLRVFIDAPQRERGVTVDDCAAVSRHLTHLLAAENIDYDRLEVSSPGLDRPLKRQADFERFSGCEIQLRLRLPADGQRNFTGVLGGIREGRVQLASAGRTFEFDMAQIEKARLVPKFEKA